MSEKKEINEELNKVSGGVANNDSLGARPIIVGAGPQILVVEEGSENTQTKDDYVNPWK